MPTPDLSRLINVLVVYALPQRQIEIDLDIAPGTTARQLALESTMNRFFPELDLSSAALGVFGELVADDYAMQEGDRLELYRELELDPMELRRKRAG